MSDVKAMVDSAVAALKAGKKSEARTTLTQAVDLDPKNEQAWLYLSALVTSLEEQEICLENVLTINPNNDRAQKALDIVLEKQGKPPKSAAPPPTPVPPPAPTVTSDSGWGEVNSGSGGGWGDIDVANWDDLVSSVTPNDPPPAPSTPSPAAPSTSDAGNADWLAGIETNPWQTNDDDPAISGSWDFAADPLTDSDPISTSVEWGGDSGVAAHGSGQNVEQPSSEEYDSWISGMNLGSSSPDSSPASEPVAETSNFGGFEEATSTSGEQDPFDTSNWSDGWTTPGIEGEADNFFEVTADESNENPFVDDFSISSLDDEPASSAFDGFRQVDEPSTSDDGNDLSDFSFDFSDEDSTFTKAVDVDEDFLALDFIDEIEEATGAQKMNLSQYFAQIPDEIDVKIKTGGGGKLGILVLLLMNVAAVIGLVIQTG